MNVNFWFPVIIKNICKRLQEIAGKPAHGLHTQPSGYRKTGAGGTEGHEAVGHVKRRS